MPDFYTALKQNGLGHMVPKSTKQRRFSPSYPTRRNPTTIQQKQAQDWARYCQTVPAEFRGQSWVEAQQPMTQREWKMQSTAASDVFDNAIIALDRLFFAR